MKVENVKELVAVAAIANSIGERITALRRFVAECKTEQKTRLRISYYGDSATPVVSAGCGYVSDIRAESSPVFWAGLQMAIEAELAARIRELDDIKINTELDAARSVAEEEADVPY